MMAMRPVVLERPDAAKERPLIVEVPHAGLSVPDEVRPELALDEDAIRSDADLYVDRIYQGATSLGATLLHSEVSRFVVDLNRAAGDVDALSVRGHPAPLADAPRGLIWRVTTDGRPALRAPLAMTSLAARLERYFHPYHAALDAEVARLRARFGYVVVLSGHSMPSVGKATHADPGRRRADVVPGDRDGTSCSPAVSALGCEHFRRAGYSVAANDPYKGGNSTRRLGRPAERIHALQVELNRDLYMDEAGFAIKEEGFHRLQAVCLGLVEALAKLDL